MKRIKQFAHQITCLRLVAFVALVMTGMFFNNRLGIVDRGDKVAHDINFAANVQIYEDWKPMSGNEMDNLGRDCAFFYGALAMLGVAFQLWRRNGHLDKAKRHLVPVAFIIPTLTILYLIAVKVTTDTTGWYDGFYMNTIMPPTAITLFCYLAAILWAVTKPKASAATPAPDSDTSDAGADVNASAPPVLRVEENDSVGPQIQAAAA